MSSEVTSALPRPAASPRLSRLTVAELVRGSAVVAQEENTRAAEHTSALDGGGGIVCASVAQPRRADLPVAQKCTWENGAVTLGI